MKIIDVISMKRDKLLFHFCDGVERKNRRIRLKVYKNSFVASEAVDFMIRIGWAEDRESAVAVRL